MSDIRTSPGRTRSALPLSWSTGASSSPSSTTANPRPRARQLKASWARPPYHSSTSVSTACNTPPAHTLITLDRTEYLLSNTRHRYTTVQSVQVHLSSEMIKHGRYLHSSSGMCIYLNNKLIKYPLLLWQKKPTSPAVDSSTISPHRRRYNSLISAKLYCVL